MPNIEHSKPLFEDKKISKEIIGCDFGLWFCFSPRLQREMLLIKIQIGTGLSVRQGCPVDIIIGKKSINDSTILSVGVITHDIKESPHVFVKALKDRDEFNLLEIFISNSSALVVIIDDLHRPVYEGVLNYQCDGDNKNMFFDATFNFSSTYEEYDLFLEEVIKKYKDKEEVENVSILLLRLACIELESKIDNVGEYFEASVYESLLNNFGSNLYKNPQVIIGKKQREFTDILLVFERFIVLIEAKSLSSKKIHLEKNLTKYAGGLINHTHKAIGQLAGAKKAFSRGEKIFDKDCPSRVVSQRNVDVYCVVLIPELTQANDWTSVVAKLEKTSKEIDSTFNVLDFREFINMLRDGSDSQVLQRNLMLHSTSNAKNNSVHRRAARPGTDIPYS
jgi:hypothetical protein